jgi:hypothetical protein
MPIKFHFYTQIGGAHKVKLKPYNRTKEKKTINEFISKPSEKLIHYQVAYYTDEITGEWICIDEIFINPEKEDMARRYIGNKHFKVFANYEDGFQEELT